MKNSSRYLSQSLATLVAHGARLISGVILPPFVIGYLGKDQYGLTVMISSVLTFVTLLQFGVPQATIRYLSESLSQNDHQTATCYYSSALVLLVVMGFTAMLIVLGIAYQPTLLGNAVSKLDLNDVKMTIMLLGGAAVLSMPLIIAESSLVARRQLVEYSVIQSIVTLIRVVVILGILDVVAHGLQVYALITALTTVLTYVIAASWHARLKPKVQFRFLAVDRVKIKTILRHGFAVTTNSIAWMLLATVNSFMVGHFLGAEQLTIYSLALVWSGLLQGISASVSQVLLSSAAGKSVVGDMASLQDLIMRASKYLFLTLMPLMVFLIIFRFEFVTTWLGTGFELTAEIMLPLLIGELFTIINSPIANISVATSLVSKTARWTMILSIIAVSVQLTGFCLGGWGLREVAITYAVIFAIRGGVVFPLIVTGHLSVKLHRFYYSLYLRPLLAFIITASVVFGIKNFGVWDGWISLIGVGVGTAILSLTISYFVVLNGGERQYMKGLIKL